MLTELEELKRLSFAQVDELVTGMYSTPDAFGNTPLHSAAKNGFRNIRKEVLTEANLIVGNMVGRTALHEAATYGTLAQIPNSVLNERTLLLPDNRKFTPLHYAAQHGNLDQIPVAIIRGLLWC